MKWLGSIFTWKRFIFYFFPLYLVIIEAAMRFAISFAPGREEEFSIAAASNSVCAAGLTLIAAVLLPKPLEVDVPGVNSREAKILEDARKLAESAGITFRNANDERIILAAYGALLILPLFWGVSLWMAHNGSFAIQLLSVSIPGPFLIALLIYIVAMILTEVKEVV